MDDSNKLIRKVIKVNDKNFEKAIEVFLNEIETDFKAYKSQYRKDYEKLKSYLNNKKYHFQPEELERKSPLTILNGSWGLGKTFFIQQLAKSFIDKKEITSDSIFEKIIIIDAWNFSNSNAIEFDFFSKVITLFSNEFKNGIGIQSIKNIFEDINFNIAFKIPPFSIGLSAKIDGRKQTKKIRRIILKNKVPTILFIDNIERLGIHSWDLIKAIIHFQSAENFQIVLTMNLKKLQSKEITVDNFKNENYIKKYVNYRMYELDRDYKSYFDEMLNNSELASILEGEFKRKGFYSTGPILSIREINGQWIKSKLDHKINPHLENMSRNQDCQFSKLKIIWLIKKETIVPYSISKNLISSYFPHYEIISNAVENTINLSAPTNTYNQKIAPNRWELNSRGLIEKIIEFFSNQFKKSSNGETLYNFYMSVISSNKIDNYGNNFVKMLQKYEYFDEILKNIRKLIENE